MGTPSELPESNGPSSTPPVGQTGLVGQLTVKQYKLLKTFWIEFLNLIDSAPEFGSISDITSNARSSNHNGRHLSRLDSSSANLVSDSENEINSDTKHIRLPEDCSEPSLVAAKTKRRVSISGPVLSSSTNSKNSIKDEHTKEKLRSGQEFRDTKSALKKYGRQKFMEAFWNCVMMDDPDVIILKFLRARKWNVSAGVAMLSACIKWRIEFGVDQLIRDGEEGQTDEFIHQLKIGKAFALGSDRSGRPVVYINVKLHKANDQSFKTIEDFTVYCMEAVRLMLTPPMLEKATIVFDMTGFGLANMDWKSLPFIIKCLEAYYPESLNVLLVHNPPWVFHGIWKIIAPMLDPAVRAKIQMTQTKEELQVYIDEKHLIQSLGGQNQLKWHYEPVRAGENDFMSDNTSREREIENRRKLLQVYVDYTKKWCQDQHIVLGDDEREAVDIHRSKKTHKKLLNDDVIVSEDFNVKAQLRKFVNHHLRAQFFLLDPYIRARTVYHRKGQIVGNGLVTFEYPQVKYPKNPFHENHRSNHHTRKSKKKNLNDEKDHQEEGVIDVYEVLGFKMSRENLTNEIERMKVRFKLNGVDYTTF